MCRSQESKAFQLHFDSLISFYTIYEECVAFKVSISCDQELLAKFIFQDFKIASITPCGMINTPVKPSLKFVKPGPERAFTVLAGILIL